MMHFAKREPERDTASVAVRFYFPYAALKAICSNGYSMRPCIVTFKGLRNTFLRVNDGA